MQKRAPASPRPISMREKNYYEENFMKKYIIERELAGAGKLTPEQLQAIAQKSCGVLRKF